MRSCLGSVGVQPTRCARVGGRPLFLALGLGWMVYKRGVGILAPSLVAYVVLLTSIFYGNDFAAAFPFVGEIPVSAWVWILLLYSFVASVLPALGVTLVIQALQSGHATKAQGSTENE